jgi:hypothetical protein
MNNKLQHFGQIIPPHSHNFIKAQNNFTRTECRITMHVDPRNLAPLATNELWMNHTKEELGNLIRMLQKQYDDMLSKERALM